MLSHPISVSTVDCISDWQNPRETDLFLPENCRGGPDADSRILLKEKICTRGKETGNVQKGLAQRDYIASSQAIR
jgi:hypothetical protein